MSHTPGPWTGFLGSRGPDGAAWLVGPPNARPIVAAVEADEEAGLTGATVEANARLIAAAPDLLECLKNLVDDEPCRLDHHGYCQTHSLSKPCNVAGARAVIASAEGRPG